MRYLKYYLFALLIIGLGIFLRFFLLTDKSLWLDEGFSLYYSQGENLQKIIARILKTDSGDRFQPLYYLVLYAWRSLFGNSEFAVRSLSALLGVGAVVILFYIALRIYGKTQALWLAVFVSISSYGVYYSQQTRAYTLLLFLAALQLYFFSPALNLTQKQSEIISRFCFWLVTGFSLFCSVFIGIFSFALSLAHLLVYRQFRRWLQWWLPAAIFCIPAVLFYLSSPVATDPTKVNVTSSTQPIYLNAIFAIYGLLVGETYGPPIEELRGDHKLQILWSYAPHLVVLTIVAIALVLLLGMAWRQKPENKLYQTADYFFIALFAVSFVSMFIFASVTQMNWLPRHSFYIYIPLAFLLSAIPRRLSQAKKPSLFNYAQAAIIALAILNIFSISNYYFNPAYQREDYRVIAQYISTNRGPADRSILLYGSPNLLPYYGDPLTINGLDLPTQNLAAEVRRVTDNASRVLIAISYQSFWEQRQNFSVEKSMSQAYTLQSKQSFTNFTVYSYLKKSETELNQAKSGQTISASSIRNLTAQVD